MSEKIKVLVLSDHPLAPSGVGTQTNYMIQSLLRTGKYKFLCLGGAMRHENYEPQILNDPDWNDGDLMVYPVDGYGNPDMIRSILWTEKPDILWFMTDPRFYPWLWQMENEIRRNVPMVYYHVWDNYPPPKYNGKWYDSTDVIVSISKVTHDIVSKVSPEVENHYLPHAVDPNIFRILSQDDIAKFKEQNFPDEKFTFYWNNRNARRKQSGTLILWFNEFAEEVGPENVRLIMHTDPFDQHGQNLEQILVDFNLIDGRVVISKEKIPPENLAVMYNMADCTINISDAEGFGLATLESLSCGTPIIVNMTGGLQEQVTDGENWFGIGIEPTSKSIIGSQEVPYIYEDRINKEDFIKALHTMYNMSKEDRDKLGQDGRKHVEDNYSFEKFSASWIKLMDDIHERHGSWDTRKNYTAWSLKEVV